MTVTRYELPAILGGGEHEAAADDPDYPRVGFDLGLAERHWIHRNDLTKVEPPLPPEPPSRSVVRVGDTVLERLDHPNGPDYDQDRWSETGVTSRFTWAELCARGTPVLLVPDPLAEAPELPWEGFTGGRLGELYVNTTTPDTDGVWVKVGPTEVRVNGVVARQMGLALLRATAAPPDPQPTARPRSCPTCHSPGMPRLRRDDGQPACTDHWHNHITGDAG